MRVPEAPGGGDTLGLDVDLYLPSESESAPAVLLAHGFGATKRSVAGDAERLRREGYVVMAYSARGFGESGGRIALNSLDFEVPDARALVDVLAGRDEVLAVDGDPVVGAVGASYGGALALMLGATDDRIDAVVASITWNDLADALVPEATVTRSTGQSQPGVFKIGWAAQLFTAAGGSERAGACGRFTAELCALYTDLVAGGALSPAQRELLNRSSPSSVLDGMTAPTLLLQGTADTLFGLDQADANARQLRNAGAPVQVTWFAGGHDAGDSATRGITDDVDSWLAAHLPGSDYAAATGEGVADVAAGPYALPFGFSVPASATSFGESRSATAYLGLGGDAGSRELRLRGHDERVQNPPGGVPATTTTLPGLGSADALLGAASAQLPRSPSERAQGAGFISGEIRESFVLTGSPTVVVAVAAARSRRAASESEQLPTEAVLFAQLRVVTGDTSVAVGGGGVAPVRVALPADGSPATVDIQLPATTWRFEKGDRVLLVLRTTDSLFRGSDAAATFDVDTRGDLTLPTVGSVTSTEPGGLPSRESLFGIIAVLIVALGLGLAAAIRRRPTRRPVPATPGPGSSDPTAPDSAGADSAGADSATAASARADGAAAAPPLVVTGLTKNYGSGIRAVDDLSFTVRRGQVLGLLGPNGAGKTTVLRMVTGLLRADAGEARIFGRLVTPGVDVLTRVGCFIEGPGFLPHLSGRRNLELFWAASGRPKKEARLSEALAIADLGSAVRRRVGGYSQGMRQRLAIAQSMLGMPELLILDEPTNGLDPPQIYALRGVLRRYAESGRAIIVSSHLLGEVEQTCSDVIVMSHGRLIAEGSVAELAGEASEMTIEVTDVDAALAAVRRLGVVESRAVSSDTIRVAPGHMEAEAVVAAITGEGVGVRSVVRGRHLEETFLAMIDTEEGLQ